MHFLIIMFSSSDPSVMHDYLIKFIYSVYKHHSTVISFGIVTWLM